MTARLSTAGIIAGALLILFGFFSSAASWYSTGERYIAVASLMVFFLVGFGLFLYLLLTESDRRKA